MDFSRELFRKHALKLGRDIALIENLESYSETLLEKGLPVIFSPQHWSLMMGQDYKDIQKILNARESSYIEFGIKKRLGGVRYIRAPKNEIKSIQYWIKEFILDKLTFPDYVTAYQKGRSIITNATPHIKQELIIKFDLKNYFDSITQYKVYGLFRLIGYNKAVSIDLAKACCVQPSKKTEGLLIETSIGNDEMLGVLPQGAPTSPAISNLAAFRLDIRLNEYAKKNGYKYTRYADDLTFSGLISFKLKRSIIKRIIEEEKFKLNERKGSYRLRSNRQLVTGLNVNDGVTISKKMRKKIETHLHNCLRFGPYAHLKAIGLDYKTNYKEWLLGHILFIKSVHPRQGDEMKKKFDKINWL